MRDAGGGLQKHEGIIGRGDVETAAGQIVLERTHVVERVIAAEGKLEAHFAFLRAVALLTMLAAGTFPLRAADIPVETLTLRLFREGTRITGRGTELTSIA